MVVHRRFDGGVVRRQDRLGALEGVVSAGEGVADVPGDKMEALPGRGGGGGVFVHGLDDRGRLVAGDGAVVADLACGDARLAEEVVRYEVEDREDEGEDAGGDCNAPEWQTEGGLGVGVVVEFGEEVDAEDEEAEGEGDEAVFGGEQGHDTGEV